MSKQENRKMINAYEQMLKDGSAFKEVDMTMHTTPEISEATGVREQPVTLTENPMGEPLDEGETIANSEYNEFDSVMEQRINSLRNKMQGGGVRKQGGTIANTPQQEILSLKKRVKKLEEALMLIMDTHEQLLS